MSSIKFIQLAKKIAERDKPTFDALMEYEKTKKVRTKERMNFTIDKSLAVRFKRYARSNNMNMSSIVEKAIKDKIAE